MQKEKKEKISLQSVMTNNFLNSEEEAELKLRINALKSASRNGHGNPHNINDEEPENEDENKLREMALKSISKGSSRKIDNKNHVSVVEKGISKHDSDDLKLRQVALKSLLQKRLLKTEDLLKKANSKVCVLLSVIFFQIIEATFICK